MWWIGSVSGSETISAESLFPHPYSLGNQLLFDISGVKLDVTARQNQHCPSSSSKSVLLNTTNKHCRK